MFFYNAYSFTDGSVISRFKMHTQLINKNIDWYQAQKQNPGKLLPSFSPSLTVNPLVTTLVWFSNTHLKSSFCRWYFPKLWLGFQNPD